VPEVLEGGGGVEIGGARTCNRTAVRGPGQRWRARNEAGSRGSEGNSEQRVYD
jgi:hypothetical protein